MVGGVVKVAEIDDDKNNKEDNLSEEEQVKEDMANTVIARLREEIFPYIWKETKERNKELSKKEVAERMFDLVAKTMFDTFADFLGLEVMKDSGFWSEGGYIKEINKDDPELEERMRYFAGDIDENREHNCKK